MRQAFYTTRFTKDVALQQRRGKDFAKLKEVISLLFDGQRLPERHRDHKPQGRFAGFRECHIDGDWLLIYKLDGETIYFTRTGTHADLFE